MNRFDCLDPALSLQGHHALEASAGTGKTFAIQHLIARLILQKISIENILIVTFTRASTRELKSRIRSNLESLFHLPPPYISHLTAEQRLSAQLHIEEALALFDQAQIFTIHGFCQRMLTEFGFEADVDFSFASQEKEEYRNMVMQEIIDFFHTSLSSTSYSAKQLTALMKYCFYDKDKLIKKVLYFIEQEGEFPNYFDYKTSELQFLSLDLPKIAFDQFLKLAPAFLKLCDKKGVLKQEYQNQYKAFLLSDFDALLTQNSLFSFLTKTNRSKKDFSNQELEPLYTLNKKLSPLINSAINPKQTLIRIARDAKHKVLQALIKNELFSPDDLLLQMKDALSHPKFLHRIQARYQAVIIDEFQDTDKHQWEIFKTLFIDQPIDIFYVVGDPKQSIYGFRNADLKTYFQAKQSMHYQSVLKTNYRSEPNLLNSLNLLFSKQSFFPYASVEPDPKGVNTIFSDQKNPVHFFTATIEKKQERTWPSSLIERDYFFPFIVREIQMLIQKKEADFTDFAILVKDRYQAMRLKLYLEAKGIPTASRSTEPLVKTSAYTFFKFFLKALIDPKQTHQLLAHSIFQLPHQRLKTNATLLKHTIVFMHKLSQLSSFHKVIDEALHYHWKPNQTLLELLVQNGTLDTYSDFMQIVELLLEQTNQSSSFLLQFLSHFPVDQVKYSRQPLSDLNTVTIMTIHMSKGLEFPIVFALGLINRYTSRQEFIRHQKKWFLFDEEHSACQSAMQEQEQEKMRQLYVALTRAKKRVYIPALFEPIQSAPFGKASPIELFLQSLLPIETLLSSISATHTNLKPDNPSSFSKPQPHLHPPLKKNYNFPSHQIHSFSSLSSHLSFSSLAIVDESLPKGAETGLLFHTLLENIIRARLTHPYKKEAIHALINKKVVSTPYSPYLDTIIHLIDLAFYYPLQAFCLADIPFKSLYPEVEFLYVQTQSSLVKGFADLIFFYNESYYILDWKTNLLADYSSSSLHVAMEENGYFLQAKIYLEALSRYLEFKKDPHPIIGAYYLFLRGIPKGEGLYFIPFKNLD